MVQESGLVCRVCGTVNDKKAKFCNECGNKLKQEKACPEIGRASCRERV